MRERGALETLEEAAGLLRSIPASTAAVYLTGAIPFSIGLLYFVTDMSRNAYASERLFLESLIAAALLIWKSVWQACFAACLYQQISLSERPPMRWSRLIAVQSAFQPASLIVLPLSLLIAIPFPWAVAFFRAVGLFAALDHARPAAAASQQARLWARANSILLSIMSLASLLLFANLLIAIVLLPQLGRSFLGIEGSFTRLGFGILNFTTLAVAAATTWLVIDPLLEAVYVIRCFRGESSRSGRDLIVALRKATASSMAIVAALLLLAPAAAAQEAPNAPVSNERGGIDAQRLDSAIHQVVRRSEFAWRTPRELDPEEEGRWVGWIRGALDSMQRAANWVAEKFRDLFRPDEDTGGRDAGGAGGGSLQIWIGVAALGLAAGMVALFLSQRGRPAAKPTPVSATVAPVNLADESVTADQLPESSWLKLAEELLEQNECRLALRALYLAGLNHPGEVQLVSIRRWKTSRDYRVELERRARARQLDQGSLALVFTDNANRFERGWYGRHPVERSDVEALASGVKEMRRYASIA